MLTLGRMAFTREHIQQVRNGRPCQVGQLPDNIWRALRWQCPWVYLGKTGLTHIEEKHPDVSDFDLLHLPQAIALGAIIHVKSDRRRLLVAYRRSNGKEKIYRAVLKSAQSGTEIWVDTFYRIRINQFDELIHKGNVLRVHG